MGIEDDPDVPSKVGDFESFRFGLGDEILGIGVEYEDGFPG